MLSAHREFVVVCLRACVPACLRACVPACLRACVPAFRGAPPVSHVIDESPHAVCAHPASTPAPRDCPMRRARS
ncbi:hypothetical protein C6V04_28560 [Burkholderia multivorans]|nr:hypothetical protein C6V04_28560 [Burkholderia multivorans]